MRAKKNGSGPKLPSTAPKRAKKGYGNNSKDELRISFWRVHGGEIVLVRAACRVGGDRE
jgi:hypothetical protein